MSAFPEIDQIRIRKQLLLVRSEINRQTLQLECANLRAGTAWIERSIDFVRTAYPLFVLVAPLLGYITGKRSLSLKGLFARGLLAYQLFRNLRP